VSGTWWVAGGRSSAVLGQCSAVGWWVRDVNGMSKSWFLSECRHYLSIVCSRAYFAIQIKLVESVQTVQFCWDFNILGYLGSKVWEKPPVIIIGNISDIQKTLPCANARILSHQPSTLVWALGLYIGDCKTKKGKDIQTPNSDVFHCSLWNYTLPITGTLYPLRCK